MTETIEQKALALVNEVAVDFRVPPWDSIDRRSFLEDVLCRAIEQHEAFRREVSDAVVFALKVYGGHRTALDPLRHFIIPQADPLVEALESTGDDEAVQRAWRLRAALAARGLKIVKKEPSQ